jgi:hypothetical protein
MILNVNSDYFLKQHQPVELCNGQVLCFSAVQTEFIKYYLDKLKLQRVTAT